MAGDSEATSSKPGPNESLDALIDFLGSDDVMEDPRFCKKSSDNELRDIDGKLHLGKIHSFFSAGQTPVSFADSAAARRYASDVSNDRVDRDMVRYRQFQLDHRGSRLARHDESMEQGMLLLYCLLRHSSQAQISLEHLLVLYRVQYPTMSFLTQAVMSSVLSLIQLALKV